MNETALSDATQTLIGSILAMKEIPNQVMGLVKRVQSIDTQLATSERALRDQRLESTRLKAPLQAIAAARHEPGCEYSYAPRWECPSCPSPEAIAKAALGGPQAKRKRK